MINLKVLIFTLVFSNFGFLFGQDIKEVLIIPINQFGGLEVDANIQLYKPSDFVITNKGEIVVCDAKEHNIVIFNKDGKLIRRFGRLGQGPAEFNHPEKVGLFNDKLIVSDDNNFRIQVLTMSGEYMKAYPVVISLAGGSRMWFRKDGSYYFNTEGYNSDNLIKHRTLEGTELGEYGKIFGEKYNYYKFETKLIKKGKIPDTLKNKVFPAAASNGSVYCIHCALPIVKKFSPNGSFIWEKNLNLPEFKQIKSNWIRINKETPSNVSFGLSYWRDVVITENGDLLLLVNLSDKMIIYRMDKNGNILARYIGVEDTITMIDINHTDLWAFSSNSHKFYHFIL